MSILYCFYEGIRVFGELAKKGKYTNFPFQYKNNKKLIKNRKIKSQYRLPLSLRTHTHTRTQKTPFFYKYT